MEISIEFNSIDYVFASIKMDDIFIIINGFVLIIIGFKFDSHRSIYHSPTVHL